MGKVKRLKLRWQLYRTSLPVRDLENFRPMDFCSTERTTGPLNDHTEGWHCSLKCCGHTSPLWKGTGLQQWPTLPHIDSSPSDCQFVSVTWIIVRGDWWLKLQYKGDNFGVGSLHYKDWWDDAKMWQIQQGQGLCVYLFGRRHYVLYLLLQWTTLRLWRTEMFYCFAEASLVNSWKWSITHWSFLIHFHTLYTNMFRTHTMATEETGNYASKSNLSPNFQLKRLRT